MKQRNSAGILAVPTVLAVLATVMLLMPAQPAAAQTVAIIHARLETVSGEAIPRGTLLMRDGRIVALGPDVQVPRDARVIDAAGKVVTPGLFAPSTNLMVNEINLVAETRDDESGDHLGAGFDLQYGINPASTHVAVARLTGVTHAAIVPIAGRVYTGGDGCEHDEQYQHVDHAALQGGGDGDSTHPALFAGQAAVVRLAAGDADPLLRTAAAVIWNFGEAGAEKAGGSRGAAIVLLKAALADARHYAAHRDAFVRGATRDYDLSRIDLEALVPVVQGRTPLLVRASRAADIRQVLALARAEKVRVILENVEEGWRVADEIAAAQVPVLIDPQDDLPRAFETLQARLDNAARLQAAGVLIAIKASPNFNSVRPVRLNAGTAVPYGLPYAAALRAITLNPARIWGVADRTGSLEVGKDADVVLWSGDPLETLSWPVAVFIGGVEQPMTSRRTELRDRYMNPRQAYPPAYR